MLSKYRENNRKMIKVLKYQNFYKSYSAYILKGFQKEETQSTAINDVLIFVLDKSGSMSGSRIDNLKKAVIDLTEKVKDGFKNVHYIAFDTVAQEINSQQISTLSASGGTSFDAANIKMFQCIDLYQEGTNFSVIYFTDGEGSVDFKLLKQNLANLNRKDVIFHTIGFSSESNKNLLTSLTQSGSSFGTFKSINSSADIKFDEFEFLFNESRRGNVEFENGYIQYFSIDTSNETSFILDEQTESPLKTCVLNNTNLQFEVIKKEFAEIEQVEERIKLFEDFFNYVLLKKIDENSNKDELCKAFSDFKLFIEAQIVLKISENSSIMEIETLNEKFSDLIQTLNSYIQETKKANSNFIELKSLSYSNITKKKFSKHLDQRAAKNELNFISNFNKIKEIVTMEIDKINELSESDFPDNCYLTQNNYKELLKSQDCLGLCLQMTRGGEVVIVDPNFIRIEQIGYSSFVSLNSMFMALKYVLDRNKDELEVLNAHGGFMKNFKSHFLDGTHRSAYNAMIPLYINEFHWKVSKLLLQPLFGYLVTLNIDGYASNQYYTLYFLVLEKIILDMIQNSNSEAIKRMFEQVKLCCQSILKEFHILNPNVKSFIEDRLKRTKDEWPNLASYILYIYLNKQEFENVKQEFDRFTYSYFEELLRRFTAKKLANNTHDEMEKIFVVDKALISSAALALFNSEDIEQNTKIACFSNEDLASYLKDKANISLINEETMYNEQMVKTLNDNFEKFSKSKSVKLFNFVFNCETDFFDKYKNASLAIQYQMVKYGTENDKWRFYKNYNRFDENNVDYKTFLRNEYMNIVFNELRSEFGKLCGDLNALRAKQFAITFLNAKNFDAFKFCIGEITFSSTSSLLQLKPCVTEIDVQRIFWFIENSFLSKSETGVWKMSKQVAYRFFKLIYAFEKANKAILSDLLVYSISKYFEEFYGETYSNGQIRELSENNSVNTLKENDKLIILKYPQCWVLLRMAHNLWKAKYLFDKYRHYIDREITGSSTDLHDYLDLNVYQKENKYAEFFQKNAKFNKPILSAPSNRKVNLIEVVSQANLKKISDLEKEWINEQYALKSKNILHDTEDWANDLTKLKHVAVLDLICDKNDNSTCAAGIMVFEIDHLKTDNKISLVEASILRTKLVQPYISGLLAFRESYAYQELLKKTTVKPQLLIFDANGLLHKREFGLASHIGVLEDCPTIGFAKKLHFVDSFPYKTLPEFKQYFQPLLTKFQDYCELKTIDNKVLGYAYLSGTEAKDPVFISQGHKVSLSTSINVIKLIDTYLNEMKKCSRESLVGFVDKMTRNYLNQTNGVDNQLDKYF